MVSTEPVPALLSGASILCRKWQAALIPGKGLPPYEEVMLGSIGRAVDHIALVSIDAVHGATVLRAGRWLQDWVGGQAEGQRVDQLPPDCASMFAKALAQALQVGQPTTSTAHRVRGGLVETCELLVLPLSSRWGAPYAAIYVRPQGPAYNLVDTIFRSTDQGILALAVVRDARDLPVDFQIVAINEGAARLLRRPEQDLCWRHLSELNLGVPAGVVPRLLKVLDSGGNDAFELTMRLDGSELHLKIGIAAIGNLLALTLTDVGDLKAREASVRLLFEGNPVPMWLYDPDDLRFVAVNDAALHHYGFTREEFLRMTLFDTWPRDEWQAHGEAARSVQAAYQSDRTWRHLKADGSEIEVLTYARRLGFEGRAAVLVAVVDVTERRQAEARIAHMAQHDALTDLPNRTLFQQRLDETLARVRRQGDRAAVLYVDLDHFKSVNDTLGHAVGDLLLRAVAERLEACLGEHDLVARLGGDEFAIIQAGVPGPHAVSALAERIVTVVSEPYEIEGHAVVVGASIGVALAPSDGETSDGLMRNADMALYRAKADGRGTFHFFEPDMDRQIQARRALELDLRKAFAHGEFELFYQPLVDLRSEAMIGFEALIRWRHPTRGMIAPTEFIPLAEEIGLIVPLGEWVLREACAEAAGWAGDLKVAVNLSPVQFKNRNLVATVVSALAASRLPPSRLELEITESVLLTENEANVAILHHLRGLGVRISLDDFGTGYSSLSYVRSFPFDKIKIDKSFVRELTARTDCRAIIRAVTGLGMSLGIVTTAEGVETREQLDRLREEGCTEVQGYLFSPPRPAAEIAGMINAQAAKVSNAA